MVEQDVTVEEEQFDPLAGEDAELENDKAFQNQLSKETAEPTEEETEEPEEESEETTETETTKVEKPETAEEIDKKDEFVFDKSKYEKQGIKDEATLKILEEKDKDSWNKDKVIGRQGQKMGDLKKDLATKSAMLEKDIASLKSKTEMSDADFEEAYNDKIIENPMEAAKMLQERNNNMSALQNAELQHQKIQTSMTIEKYVPEFMSLTKEIAEIMKEDISPEQAERFLADPFSEHPGTAINLARVVLERRQNVQLKAEVEALKKQLESSPKATIDKLKNVGKNTTTITTSTSSSDKKSSQKGLPVELQSMDDLNDDN